MGSTNFVHLEDCEFVRATEKAVCVKYEEIPVWIPFSQTAEGEERKVKKCRPGDVFTLTVSEWIAKEKNLSVE